MPASEFRGQDRARFSGGRAAFGPDEAVEFWPDSKTDLERLGVDPAKQSRTPRGGRKVQNMNMVTAV